MIPGKKSHQCNNRRLVSTGNGAAPGDSGGGPVFLPDPLTIASLADFRTALVIFGEALQSQGPVKTGLPRVRLDSRFGKECQTTKSSRSALNFS